jgi:mannosylglycerate hydrolase
MATTEAKQRTFMVVSHTHWDREWYQPFEAFRARLLRMMDALIDLLERDPEFKHFVMDGQTVPLDDYLEIRPDRRETVERLVREGRLLAGPNYILPDEFLIGGEAWIRNLMVGIRSAREYGAVMNVGYSPDAFGHIAHLPAILHGFGLDSVVIWRGVGREVNVSEFRWAAPDGSEVMVVHFPTPAGYSYLSEVPGDETALRNVLTNMRAALEPYATTSHVLVPNGTDHLPAREGLSRVIKSVNSILADAEFRHGTYPEFVAAVRGELGDRYEELPVITGEFRSSSRSNILAGVLSTRMWLKQRQALCEDLLARYAEPLAAWSHLLRGGIQGDARTASDRALLQHAWRLLLQNGPHDSVTGCSVDAVYEDVGLRYDRVEQIAESLLGEYEREIGRRAARPGQESVVVFNPENGPRTAFCTVRVTVSGQGLPTHLADAAGAEVPLQVIERGLYSPVDKHERALVGFVAPAVPGFGYKAFAVGYGSPPIFPETDGVAIENEAFRVTAEADGTISVVDRRSGRVLSGLNRFEDSGEGGDEYTYSPPEHDEFVREPTGAVSRLVTESGPARWTLEVRQTYSLPARISLDRASRSTERVDCEIVSRVRLYPGVSRVDIETEVENRAEDHRLRVLFPSGVVSQYSHAEQHFGVVERPTAPVQHDSTWYERPVNTHPQKTFTDLNSGSRGLMIANHGLPEYEVLTEADGTATLALTLLRCVSWLSRDDLPERQGHAGPGMYTPGAQLPGRWRFDYSVIPHEGGWEAAFAEAHRFARPMRAVRVSGGTRESPEAAALLAVDSGDVVVSTVKLAEDNDGVVVRVYNVGDMAAQASIRLHGAPGPASIIDLNEENARSAPGDGRSVTVALKRNEIVTLRFGA